MTDIITYISLIASALIGGALVFVFKNKLVKSIKLFTAFSGAFLLAICFLHLMPEIFSHYNRTVGLFILIGFLIQLLLEFFSDGIEHGHYHAHAKKLVTFPIAIFLSLCIHSFLEGMALMDHGHSHGEYEGNSLLVGILIHKIPVAIVLATLLISKNLSKATFVIGMLIFSLSAPLGLFLASQESLPIHQHPEIVLAIAIGIFLHISTTILFESSEGHRFDLKKFAIVLLGFAIAYFTQ